MNKKNIFVFSAAVIIAVLDQLTKYIIRKNFDINESLPVIKNIFHISYVTNTGTAFSLFQGVNFVFVIISFAVIFGILYSLKKIKENEKPMQFAVGLLLGGAAGNLIDRLLFGHVTDFLDFRIWPVFNVADSAISVSVVLLVILLWKK
ncbi:MAG TPA: signal peptidase II [Candidatus Nanoarchaeia archaeon]|nr:signal peptidase II [Candidatus Nanoarchaeia archaeon]